MLKWPLKRSSSSRWDFGGSTTSRRPCAARPPSTISSSVRVSGSSDRTVSRSRNMNSTFAMRAARLYADRLPAAAVGGHVTRRHHDREAPPDFLVDARLDIHGIVRLEDFAHALARAVANVAPAGGFPFVGARAVTELRV